jgi:hypothetical protein
MRDTTSAAGFRTLGDNDVDTQRVELPSVTNATGHRHDLRPNTMGLAHKPFRRAER